MAGKMVRVTVNFPPMVFEMVDAYVRDNLTGKVSIEDIIKSKAENYLDENGLSIDKALIKTEFGLWDTISAQGYDYKEFVDFSEDDYDDFDDDEMGGIKVTLGTKNITEDIY